MVVGTTQKLTGTAPAQRAQLLGDLIDEVDLLDHLAKNVRWSTMLSQIVRSDRSFWPVDIQAKRGC